MKQLLTTKIREAKRLVCAMLAALLVVAALPMFQPHSASAAQFASRYIKLSDSGPSGGTVTTGVGSGTNVTYQVSFTATGAAHSMVIDFCANTPLIGSACTLPTAMVTTAATLVPVAGNVTVANNWVIDAATNGVIKIHDNGVAGQEITAGTQTFNLVGITNPSTVGSFYGRMYDYANNTYGGYTGPTVVGTYVDYGGIAMSTVSTIRITARVQEQLTFCITKANPSTWTTTNDCSDPVVGQSGNLPNIVLGHGTTPDEVLDAGQVDTATLYSQLSTNASGGAVVRMRTSNTVCAGLSSDGGATCSIPPQNTGSGAGASNLPAGTAAFGLYVSDGAVGTGGLLPGATTFTPAAAYHDAAHTPALPPTWYGMDSTTLNNSVTSAFGSTLCSSNGPLHRINTSLIFAAAASLTTPAGIYTANLSVIATGTF